MDKNKFDGSELKMQHDHTLWNIIDDLEKGSKKKKESKKEKK